MPTLVFRDLLVLFASLWVKIASWRPTEHNCYELGQEESYLCGGPATSGHRLLFISRPLLLFVHAVIDSAHQDPSWLIRSQHPPLASSTLFAQIIRSIQILISESTSWNPSTDEHCLRMTTLSAVVTGRSSVLILSACVSTCLDPSCLKDDIRHVYRLSSMQIEALLSTTR
ncbi:hypothetical protein BC629DRAFT_1542738 [Irpex lacteus]|nr:hypothetical protein BC629DRAFT_1542738 [Irpex lacteus]